MLVCLKLEKYGGESNQVFFQHDQVGPVNHAHLHRSVQQQSVLIPQWMVPMSRELGRSIVGFGNALRFFLAALFRIIELVARILGHMLRS